ncbi:hypothetical protein SERLA73DRAFT_117101 [Serpula lacrymans var. lacrymans S7.3]|uniref:Heme haloperoxidase family profile domain-containing protein n=2 Tax=Serpula lacrymans var. lacrymans TaxID=341189 RepID=F8QGH5_SERL3|nr:uncharacterized protein SERLADRAFT_359936 [Serpula lacrymans var. lacrymans S7.9]EGN92653.1 hypothetical protein SERLA73DRAFT_117101 [Serpula lacrymans var. lacrymans S7.3]EGO28721.1 hypothetical protein SERLADRAFT_359936 [Serpula lacrymans var. lacrymans S7.9]
MSTASWQTSEHKFVPSRKGDRRAPCPALNAMANHGYLPHNGKNIGLWQLILALRQVYNLSFPLAAFLALAGMFLCGHALHLDLDALAAHNKIEHDASLVHGDTEMGQHMAPTCVDSRLLQSFLAQADTKTGMSLKGFAKLRIQRERGLKRPLDMVHAAIGKGEVGLSWLLLKEDNGRIPYTRLYQWYGEERLPDGWHKPSHEVGLLQARQKANEVAAFMRQLKGWQDPV